MKRASDKVLHEPVTCIIYQHSNTAMLASFPVPRPAFSRLQYDKAGRTASDEKLGMGWERGYCYVVYISGGG